MPAPRLAVPLQFGLGLLFGLGLILAGLTDPAKVLAFLDVAAIPSGAWDPSLALVLLAATGTTFLGYRIALARPAPLMDRTFHLPHRTAIDAPILMGPAIFGVGWGLVGLCPGPALVALGTGRPEALLFVPAMILGLWAARLLALREIKVALAGP